MFHVIGSDFVTSLPRNSENSWRMSRKIGICDFSVTKNGDFVTFLSRKMRISWLSCHEKWGFRDFPVTKYGDFVTILSRKIGISRRIYHETNSSSHETIRFHDISVTKLDTLMKFNEKSLFYFIKYVLRDQWLL